MQFSCLPVSFYAEFIAGRLTLRQWAHLGIEVGLDGIDASVLMFPDTSPAALTEARSQIEGEGTRLVMLTSYPDFSHPDAAQRERELELARRQVDMAAALGGLFLRITAGQAHPETPVDAGIVWVAEAFHRLGEYAGGSGVTLVYENHGKPGSWRYRDFSAPEPVFTAIFEATEDMALSINFDTANATRYARDPLELLRRVLPRLRTLHANDLAGRAEEQPFVLLGTGIVRFEPFFQVLKQADWQGWICIEECGQQGAEGVRRAAEFVRRAWGEA